MTTLARVAALLALASVATSQRPLTVEGLPGDAPMSIAASASAAELVVDLAIQPEWHLYARDTGGGQPIEFVFGDDSHFAAAGEPQIPADARGQVIGSVRIVVPLRRVAAMGDKLAATLRFSVCDPLECLPPMAVALTGRIASEPPQVLLVVASLGERSQRIREFVEARGFGCEVTTYDAVSAAECDRHAVVVADSELSDAASSARARAAAFPRTTAPIVAVGYLGTVLIEAHGLAMTSGYI